MVLNSNTDLAIIVLLAGVVALPPGLGAAEQQARAHAGMASASANAAVTVIDPGSRSCDERRLRTRSFIHNRDSAGFYNSRAITPRCAPDQGGTGASLVVEYRESNGSTVSVRLDNGAVSVLQPAGGNHASRAATGAVHFMDVILSYD